MYEKVLPGAVLSAAIILPNTGSNRVMAVASIITIAVGVVVGVSSLVRLIARRSTNI